MLPNLERDSPSYAIWAREDTDRLTGPDGLEEHRSSSVKNEKKRSPLAANVDRTLNPLDLRRRSADNRTLSSAFTLTIQPPASSSRPSSRRLAPTDGSARQTGSRSPVATGVETPRGSRSPNGGGRFSDNFRSAELCNPSASVSSNVENARQLGGSRSPRAPSAARDVAGSRSPPTPRQYSGGSRSPPTRQFSGDGDPSRCFIRRRRSLGEECGECVMSSRGAYNRQPESIEKCNSHHLRMAVPTPSTISTAVGCSSAEASPRMPAAAWESVPDSRTSPVSAGQPNRLMSLWERRKQSNTLVVQTEPIGPEARDNGRCHSGREMRRPPAIMLCAPSETHRGQLDRRVQSFDDMRSLAAPSESLQSRNSTSCCDMQALASRADEASDSSASSADLETDIRETDMDSLDKMISSGSRRPDRLITSPNSMGTHRRASPEDLRSRASEGRKSLEVPQPPSVPRSSASPVGCRPTNLLRPQAAAGSANQYLELVGSWEFDALGTEAHSGHVLQQVGRRVLDSFDCVSRPALADLLSNLEGKYLDNPYHSYIHAADMCNSFMFLARTIGIWDAASFAPHLRAMSLLAALGHDVAHPARTNMFLVRTEHAYSQLYGDKGVLEQMHAATLMRLVDSLANDTDSYPSVPSVPSTPGTTTSLHSALGSRATARRGLVTPPAARPSSTQPRCASVGAPTSRSSSRCGGLFPALTSEEFSKGRNLMTMLVLQTDASKHLEALGAFRKRMTAGGEAAGSSEPGSPKTPRKRFEPMDNEDDQQQCLSMIFRAADLGHSAKRWDLHQQWTNRITQEFHTQGDEEKILGLPVSPLCEREGFVLAHEQVCFLQFVCVPTWLELSNCEAYLNRTKGQVLWDVAISHAREMVTPSPICNSSDDDDKTPGAEVWEACRSAMRKLTGRNKGRPKPSLDDICYKQSEGNRQRWKSLLENSTSDGTSDPVSSKDAKTTTNNTAPALANEAATDDVAVTAQPAATDMS